jgi:hypothetical protein
VENLPLLPLEPSAPPPSPPPPPPSAEAPAASKAAAAAAAATARLRTTLAGVASFFRRRRRVILIGGTVVHLGGAAVFIALQQVPPPPVVVEEAPAPVAPPPKPLQADAPGWYEPGYQFTVADRRFTRLTLRPDPFITFRRTGTRQEFSCGEATITPQTLRLRCEIERVGVMAIDGRFVNRVATTRLDAPTISAVLTVRNLRGEILYSARDNFVWHQPDSIP